MAYDILNNSAFGRGLHRRALVPICNLHRHQYHYRKKKKKRKGNGKVKIEGEGRGIPPHYETNDMSINHLVEQFIVVSYDKELMSKLIKEII